jgi:hypothetical protein
LDIHCPPLCFVGIREFCWYLVGIAAIKPAIQGADTDMLTDTRIRDAKPNTRPIKLSDAFGCIF